MFNQRLGMVFSLIISLMNKFVSNTSSSDIFLTTKLSEGSLRDKIIAWPGSFLFYSRSKIHCGVICAELKCPSYFYNHLNRKCRINDVTLSDSGANNEVGWRFYFAEETTPAFTTEQSTVLTTQQSTALTTQQTTIATTEQTTCATAEQTTATTTEETTVVTTKQLSTELTTIGAEDTTTASQECPFFSEEFKQGGKHICYFHLTSSQDEPTSETLCASSHSLAKLAYIPNEDAWDFVLSRFTFPDGSQVYIGVNDKATEGVYVDSDGDPQTFLEWDSDHSQYPQPNDIGHSQNCMRYYYQDNSFDDWHDKPCTGNNQQHPAVCSINFQK